MSLFWLLLGNLEDPDGTIITKPNSHGQDGIDYFKNNPERMPEREVFIPDLTPEFKSNDRWKSNGFSGSKANTKIRKFKTVRDLPEPAERYTADAKTYSDST